jgi:hypothetical protein
LPGLAFGVCWLPPATPGQLAVGLFASRTFAVGVPDSGKKKLTPSQRYFPQGRCDRKRAIRVA